MKELLIRTLTGISIVVLVAGSILLGPVTFTGVLLIIYLLGVKELFNLLQKRDLPIRWYRSIPGALLILLGYSVFQYELNFFFLLIPAALWLFSALRVGITLSGTLAFLWLGIPLAGFLALGWMEDGVYQSRLPLAIIALVWITDTFAYLTGSLLGKHQGRDATHAAASAGDEGDFSC